MANYDPNRPRPSVDGAAALPGDVPAVEGAGTPAASSAAGAPVADADAGPVPSSAPEHAADSDADPAPAPATHLLPRQAEPVDRRLLAAFGGTVAVGWLAAAAVAWWMWQRRRRRR